MPRRTRIKLGDEPHHIIQRGNNRSACSCPEEDYRFYLERVAVGAIRYRRAPSVSRADGHPGSSKGHPLVLVCKT